jgi:hypothetical protein
MVESPQRVAEMESQPPRAARAASWRGGAIAGVCLLVLVLAVVGGRRWLGLGGPPTPLGRVGRALVEGAPGPRWRLRADVEALRSTFVDEQRAVFELLVGLRGFETGGSPDWGKVAERCRGLKWPRCDQAALEEMARRTRLAEGERKSFDAAPALAMANLVWGFGSEASVRKMVRAELDRIPESEGALRGRVFLRFGIIDTNFDGQAALFNAACAADAAICDHTKEATEREVRARAVAPGNVMPLFFVGHPRIAGP